MSGQQSDTQGDDYDSLNFEEQDMIRGVVTLSDTTVKEVIVPRIDVEFVAIESTFNELIDTLGEGGYSRFPVYKDTIDNVVGILYVKDLLKQVKSQEDFSVEKIIRRPYFVPESKRLDSLLREFKRRKVHIAVAVDEYGGVSGIVCLEDIIEEIVGDIQDEFDNEVEDILEIGEGTYLCDARVDIEDLNEKLSLMLPEEDFDTLGGFVFDMFGKIPVKYEKVKYSGIDFIIQEMDGHKIKTVKLVIKDSDSAA
ncbi:MAG: hemolysin family protein [Spirochaetaceae bacterium]|nr:hemolysin family protein [Spirochaetaceae bacterium]MCF7948031.1 hemolysin family protein [Spirochaetia bacterium]MCF7950411.1 hemolysin family protein [Spirochaetaceae bacterium]